MRLPMSRQHNREKRRRLHLLKKMRKMRDYIQIQKEIDRHQRELIDLLANKLIEVGTLRLEHLKSRKDRTPRK